jgi:hypothetical protein
MSLIAGVRSSGSRFFSLLSSALIPHPKKMSAQHKSAIFD